MWNSMPFQIPNHFSLCWSILNFYLWWTPTTTLWHTYKGITCEWARYIGTESLPRWCFQQMIPFDFKWRFILLKYLQIHQTVHGRHELWFGCRKTKYLVFIITNIRNVRVTMRIDWIWLHCTHVWWRLVIHNLINYIIFALCSGRNEMVTRWIYESNWIKLNWIEFWICVIDTFFIFEF